VTPVTLVTDDLNHSRRAFIAAISKLSTRHKFRGVHGQTPIEYQSRRHAPYAFRLQSFHRSAPHNPLQDNETRRCFHVSADQEASAGRRSAKRPGNGEGAFPP
jgi:hypothetical protein